jgi:HD-GYP domain-containing protein (c-di-GMP phosphodiesterase class II)
MANARLRRCGKGKAVAALVLRHHERLDGSGYHRGVKGTVFLLAARDHP